jgi:hypothetical protein
MDSIAILHYEMLNDAILRFDPLYLQKMYQDSRSRREIQKEATQLLIDFVKNPQSESAQNEITRFYHFENFSELQKVSQNISIYSKELNLKYLSSNAIGKEEKINYLIELRKKIIQQKITSLVEQGQKKASGLWSDMADETERLLSYWTTVQNEEFDLSNTGSAECSDACCFEYKACLTRAASAYRVNFLTMGATLAATGGSLGALYGSIIPFIGTTAVGTGAGIIGGVAGFIQAVNVYLKDQDACVYSYKACVIRQNQK